MTKGKIKVIKKSEQRGVEKTVTVKSTTAKQQVRDMVGNVTSWVSELQQRKSEEAKVAFEQLFGQIPQTTNA